MFDVAGRLADGEPILADLETYVAACEKLGYRYGGPDLRRLYTAEAGLDLRSLDADHRVMLDAAHRARDVVTLQHNVSSLLQESWSGTAGATAGGFLGRQVDAARSVVGELQRAADALAVLREELSAAVDRKVAAVVAAGDRPAGRREAWRAAALTVLHGGGDQSVASEVVDQQITPFLDAVVCGEIVPTLQSATNDVANSYDSAISSVRPTSVWFEMPGDFGPIAVAHVPAIGSAAAVGSAATAAPVLSSPTLGNAATMTPTWAPPAVAAATEPAAAMSTPAATAPDPAPAVAPPVAPEAAQPMSASSSLPPDLGIGSAVGGFGRQLSDLLGGALGSAAGLTPDAAGLADLADDPNVDASDDSDAKDGEPDGTEPDGTESDDAKSDDAGTDDKPAETDPAQEGSTDEAVVDTELQQPEAPAATPPPLPAPLNVEPPPPPVEPLAVQDQPIDKTPCQIAADELPQVGA